MRFCTQHFLPSDEQVVMNRTDLFCGLTRRVGLFIHGSPLLLPLVAAAVFLAGSASAAGIYRDGVGARAMSLGGADVAWAKGPLGAFGNNPAGFGWQERPAVEFGGVGVLVNGKFNNAVNNDSSLRNNLGGWPELALGAKLPSSPVRIFAGAVPEAAMSAHWRYVDAPGGADTTTTYGLQRHESEITVLRAGAGLAVELTPQISFGAALGALYNENRLHAPYIFQTQPTLRSVKTLLDLETSGFGWNAQFGFVLRPTRELQFGLIYKTRTVVESEGDASGNAGVQLANLGMGAARPDFHYDAEVVNAFPQMVSGGVSWQCHPRWRLAGQLDWIDWSGAFDNLHVKLRNGNNTDLNGLVGSDAMEDFVPLRWKNQLIVRGGAEFSVTDSLRLRGGYSYGNNPVPGSTLTPLTAAIMKHTLTSGAGWERGRWTVDFAYQWSLPHEQQVGTSALQAGEYSNSEVRVGVHWFGLTTGVQF